MKFKFSLLFIVISTLLISSCSKQDSQRASITFKIPSREELKKMAETSSANLTGLVRRGMAPRAATDPVNISQIDCFGILVSDVNMVTNNVCQNLVGSTVYARPYLLAGMAPDPDIPPAFAPPDGTITAHGVFPGNVKFTLVGFSKDDALNNCPFMNSSPPLEPPDFSEAHYLGEVISDIQPGENTVQLDATFVDGKTIYCAGDLFNGPNPLFPKAGLVLWLDSADSTTVTVNNDCSGGTPAGGGSVGCWKDKSGSGNDAYNTTNNPTYATADLINNIPTIHFNDLSSQRLETNFQPTTPVTTFIVFKSLETSDTERQYILGVGTDSSTELFGLGVNYTTTATGPTFGSIGSSIIEGTNDITTNDIVLVSFSADDAGFTNYVLSKNTAIEFAAASAVTEVIHNGANKLHIGSIYYSAAPALYFNGLIAEVLLYDRILDPLEKLDVEKYLSAKWGLGLF